MFNLNRRSPRSPAPIAGAGSLLIPIPANLRSVLDRLGERWGGGPERAAQRIIVLALTGWKPQYADLIERLSRFVPDREDPFQRTCLLLRGHFDAAEVELGEEVKECDRIAWLETLLEALRERRKHGRPAKLASLLADGAFRTQGDE